MRHLYPLLIPFALIAYDAHAQFTYQRSIGGNAGDAASSLISTNGGYLMVGTTATLGGGDDEFHLVKLDGNGDTLWTRSYGGNADDYPSGVAPTSDGGYLAYGQTESFGATDKDLMLLRTDGNGGVQWARRFVGSGNDYARAIVPTTNGDGFLICGSTYEGAGVVDAFVVHLNNNGDTLWTRVYGGAMEDDGDFVLPTGDGGFILAGITQSSGAGSNDVLVIKCLSNGNVEWARTYGGAGDEYAFHIEEASGGGYVLAGTTTSTGAGSYDMFLLKIDATGTANWAATFGSAANDLGGCVRNAPDGGYLIFGQSFGFGTASDLYLVHTDATGGHLWSRTYGGNGYEFESNFVVMPDNGYLLCGGEESFGSGRNAYLIKTDADGNSGCHEGTPATVAGLTSPTTGTPTLTVSHLAITATPISGNTGHVGTSTIVCSTVGIDPLPSAVTGVFPDPFVHSTTIHFFRAIRNGRVELFDPLGQLARSILFSGDQARLERGDLRAGIYSYRVLTNGTTIAAGRIIAE